MSRISKKEIGRCFKLILKALETSVDLITTGDFMSRFCSNLGLPKQVQMAATYIARKAVELDLVPGRSPISVAAAAIYMASQASAEKKTQKGKRKQIYNPVNVEYCDNQKRASLIYGSYFSLVQRLGTSLEWQTSPSVSPTVSFIPALPISFLQTSSSTHQWINCLNCEHLCAPHSLLVVLSEFLPFSL